jgi:hypothetical protein
MKHKFGDLLPEGVVIDVEKKRKWTYYTIIPKKWEAVWNDWDREGAEYVIYREDELTP